MPRKKSPVLEKDIENKFVKEAKKLGCMTRKLNGLGFASWPDRLVLVPGGVTLLFEFKRPGEGLRPAQVDLHEEAKKMGHHWYVFDNWEEPLEIVRMNMC